MRYFVNEEKRSASDPESYIEFQLPTATEEFGDKTSLYMHKTTMIQTGFCDFWYSCMLEDIVFDMESFDRDELAQMADKANRCGGTVLEVIGELKAWVDAHLAAVITINWAFD